MFLDSRSLTWIYPQVLLSCPPRSEITIASPWISDLQLELPNPLRGKGVSPYLSTLLEYLQEERDVRITIYYRDDEKNDLRKLLDKLTRPTRVQTTALPMHHAKGIATPKLILAGSANVLWRSFNVNEENVSLSRNTYASVSEAVAHAFNIQ